ncbi:MAG: tyrosine-type recombinase/integrase [Syntrophobacteraceae bacterium]
MKRQKTKYPGVFFREAERIGGPGIEKVFYIVFKKDGKVVEEKAGRQYKDNMTEAKAAGVRAERIEGKRISRKEERERLEAEREEERRIAEEIKWTVDRIWQEYKSGNSELKGLRIDEYRYAKYLKSDFGEKLPAELVPLDVDRARIKLQKAGAKPKSVSNVLELLRRLLNFGQKKHLCPPLGFIVQMPEVHNEKTEDLTPEELGNLLDAIEGETNMQAANLVRLAIFTGMRRGELFKLKWEDIDFERGFISLRDPKGGPDQKIPLNEDSRQVLENHPRKIFKSKGSDSNSPKKESPYVFPGRGGRQRTTISKLSNRIKKSAGLPEDFRPLHGLRHAYASMLASSGQVDMYTLQKLLTHKDPKMTQRYAHLRDETLKNASSLAGNIIGQAPRKGKENNVVDMKAQI